MKVEQKIESFVPVTITLNTQSEVDLFFEMTDIAYGESDSGSSVEDFADNLMEAVRPFAK
jgi:hypothetical protein